MNQTVVMHLHTKQININNFLSILATITINNYICTSDSGWVAYLYICYITGKNYPLFIITVHRPKIKN